MANSFLGGSMIKDVLGLAVLALTNLAIAGEPSLAELSQVPMSIEVKGVVLTAAAFPYFNLEPRIYLPGQLGRATCESDSRFNVPVRIVSSDENDELRRSIDADRVWVVQGENVWRGSIKPGDHYENRSYGKMTRTFVSRGCGQGIKFYGPGVSGQAEIDASPPAYTVIRLHVGQATILLRSPESPVGAAM
jgi:hypothetical protein